MAAHAPTTTKRETPHSKARGQLFKRRYDERWLLDVVAAVARTANPKSPLKVSQRAYDAARARSPFPDAPAAQPTTVYLRRGWSRLLSDALKRTPNGRGLVAGQLKAVPAYPGLDEEAVRGALRRVALRLGQDGRPKASLTRDEYTAERRRLLAAQKRRYRHGRDGFLPLPTFPQIAHAVGSWQRALEIAELDSMRGRPIPRGVPTADAIEFCLEAHGALPTVAELVRFAKANDFGIAWRADNGRQDFPGRIAALRARRASEGKWTPPGRPPPDQRPDYAEPIELSEALLARLIRREKRNWTRARCVEALAALIAELGDEHPTSARYQELCRRRTDLPTITTIVKFGKFSEMREEAKALFLAQRAEQREHEARDVAA